MGILLPIDGSGYDCKLYTGAKADRFFRFGMDVERVSHDTSMEDLNVLALFQRHNKAGCNEAGVYYCPTPENGPSELLRFFSDGPEAYEAAESLYEDLHEGLDLESCIVVKDYQSIRQPSRHGCCKCGSPALWQLIREATMADEPGLSFSSVLFACNEHVEQVLQELREKSGGGWQSRFVEEDENNMELLPPEV